jgi:hypothetical protein
LFALASLLAVVVAGLLQIATPTQAQTAPKDQTQVAQAQTAKPNNPTDVVLDWNTTTLTVVPAPPTPPPQQYRTLAIVHAAIFDAVNAIERRYAPYAIDIKAPLPNSTDNS